jgi:hypothetical protein
VDIHVFVHSWLAAQALPVRRVGLAGKGRRCNQAGKRAATIRDAGSEVGRQQSGQGRKKNFANPQPSLIQVYNQNRYTRIVVVLTSAIFCG